MSLEVRGLKKLRVGELLSYAHLEAVVRVAAGVVQREVFVNSNTSTFSW